MRHYIGLDKTLRIMDNNDGRSVKMIFDKTFIFTTNREEYFISTLGEMGYNFKIEESRFFKTTIPTEVTPGNYRCPNCCKPVSHREEHIEDESDMGPDTYECNAPTFLDRL